MVATEEPLALIAFGTLQGEYPNALLVLAPRKPERFDAGRRLHPRIAPQILATLAIADPELSRTAPAPPRSQIPNDVTVLLLDSIGELASLYRCADGVFVGGSLVESGGHNILEPAAFGKIPVFGPSMENFAEMASRFVSARRRRSGRKPGRRRRSVDRFLSRSRERTRAMGETARSLVEDSRGATDRALAANRAESLNTAGSPPR